MVEIAVEIGERLFTDKVKMENMTSHGIFPGLEIH